MFDLSLIENRKSNITYFAKTNSRGKDIVFGIKDKDRMKHIYVIGKTGMGKSTMIENMAAQDIINGNGLCFIDPHGSAIEFLLDYIPKERVKDVVYFAPFDSENPLAFNVMEDVGAAKRHLVAQGILSSMKKVFGEESFSDRMEHILNNVILALLEYPNTTLLSMTRILTDNNYKKKVVANIQDPSVKGFWENEYNKWEERYRKEAVSAILNKVGQFTSNPLIRNIVGQVKSSIDFREAMDSRKIILVNLSIGQLGEGNSKLLGALLTTKIFLSAMSRAEHTQAEIDKMPGFYFYIDEFQNVTSDTFADILSQARKYKLSLTVAHQYLEQMPEVVRDAIFGNIGTTITFRVGAAGAEVLEKEFSSDIEVRDLVSLGFTKIYLTLSIDGVTSSVFSATTLPPIKKPDISFAQEVIEYSREKYTKPVEIVNQDILNWLNISDKKENLPKKETEKKVEKVKDKKNFENKIIKDIKKVNFEKKDKKKDFDKNKIEVVKKKFVKDGDTKNKNFEQKNNNFKNKESEKSNFKKTIYKKWEKEGENKYIKAKKVNYKDKNIENTKEKKKNKKVDESLEYNLEKSQKNDLKNLLNNLDL